MRGVSGHHRNGAHRIAFAVPGDLSTPTGGYIYDRRIIHELRAYGWHVDVVDVGDCFPFPSGTQRAAALSILSEVPGGCPIVLDGLAFGAMPELRVLSSRNPLVALVHQPLATDPGLTRLQATALLESERAALRRAAHVIATSSTTAHILTTAYGVPSHSISVVIPGTDPAPWATGSTDGIVRLLSIGSVVPVKGYDVLVEALALLNDAPWQLTIAGDRTRDPATASQLDEAIAAAGLQTRISVLGAVKPERVGLLYSKSDLFVLASRFESYGMALADAVAHGLPVVSTNAGAIPDTVPANAGLLVPPDNPHGLADALREMIEHPRERFRRAANARAAARRLPAWSDAGRSFADALQAVLPEPINREAVRNK